MDSKIKRNRIIAIIVIVVMVLAMAGTFFLSASKMKSRGFSGQFSEEISGEKPEMPDDFNPEDFQPGNSTQPPTDSNGESQMPSMPDNGNFKAPGGGATGIIFNACYAVEGILLGMAAMYLIMTRDKSDDEDDDDEEESHHC